MALNGLRLTDDVSVCVEFLCLGCYRARFCSGYSTFSYSSDPFSALPLCRVYQFMR